MGSINVQADGGGEKPIDATFGCLSHGYRRQLLMELDGGDRDEIQVGNIPEVLESDNHADEYVRTAMYHIHLPKLAAAGLISRDTTDGCVSKGPEFEVLEDAAHILTG